MQALFEKLTLTASNDIPYIFPKTDYAQTYFDLAVNSPKSQTWMIERFVQLIMQTDPTGILYSSLIDRNLKQLFK